MTKTVLPLTIGLLAISFLRAQEISPSPSPSAIPARSVRINFVPPPLEGKICLGVYNEWGQLVRVLHQEAEFDEFTIGRMRSARNGTGRMTTITICRQENIPPAVSWLRR